MNCTDAQEALDAAADSELPADRVADLEGHLAQCEVCARERQRMAAYDTLVAGLRYPDPGPELDQRLSLEALESKRTTEIRPARPLGLPRLPRAALAASVMFACLLLGVMWRSTMDQPEVASNTAIPYDQGLTDVGAPSMVTDPPLERYTRAYQLHQQGRSDEAIKAFESLLAQVPGEPGISDKALFWVGELRSNSPDESRRLLALRAFATLLDRFPASKLAPAALARVARISGDSARYVELTRCFPKSPQAYRAALELARRAQRTKNKQEAEKWWRWLLENAVGSPEWEVARKALQQR